MFVAVVVAATVSTDSYQLYKAKSTGDWNEMSIYMQDVVKRRKYFKCCMFSSG
jgi:hypothetical protein